MAKDSDDENPASGNLGKNRKAYHEYFVEDTLECGIELMGTEVKSMKRHHFNFVDSYVEVYKGELWLKGLQINPWAQGNIFNHEPTRTRRLLAHKKEIEKFRRKVDEKGYTLIPLSFYLTKGLIKVEIGLCKGKKAYDKRADIKGRDLDREAQRTKSERFD